MALFGLFSKKIKDKGWFHPLLYPLSWFEETYLNDATGNTSPSIALNSPADASSTSDTTPTLEFTGTDADGNAIEYQVQIDTVNTFDSQVGPDVYATWDPANKDIDVNLSNGNLWADGTNTGGVRATIPIVATAKKQFEIELDASSGVFDVFIGLANSSYNFAGNLGADINGWAVVQDDWGIYHNGFTSFISGFAIAAGDIIGVVVDNGNVYYYKNGTILNGGSPVFTGLTGNVYPAVSIQFETVTLKANFGATAFAYPVSGATGVFAPGAGASPLLNKVSETDAGFLNTVNGGNTHPFTSAEKVSFTVQAGDALSLITYYWRARAKDPLGTNGYSSWSAIRSFTVTSGGGGSSVKTVLGLIKASMKTWNNLANVNVKSINNLQ